MLPRTALVQARRRAGLSQRALAAKVGMPQSTVARIESGAIDPRVSTLDTLLRACGDELRAVRRIGEGIDRTLSRGLLEATPDERARSLVQSAINVATMWSKRSR